MCEADCGVRRVWERFCPCRLNKKNSVLMVLTVLCFALVTWTVVATIHPPKGKAPSNQTYVIIDDSRDFQSLNFTMRSVVPIRTKPTKPPPSPRPTRSFYQPLKDEAGNTFCKCICDLNVTVTELAEAVTYLQIQASLRNVTNLRGMTLNATTTTMAPKVLIPPT